MKSLHKLYYTMWSREIWHCPTKGVVFGKTYVTYIPREDNENES